ncbi:MAG: NADP-dependent glyceraldehyde-3-phosphate dehydrogenase [Pseudomonadales bacterium]|nr:NADP-dependent glyceraldehyde-3-phosphate dehydrogenase [Pseudomonadales bacterium]
MTIELEDSIPVAYRLQFPIRQNTYLCNGELKTWQGDLQAVQSPVTIASQSDAQTETASLTIGYYPLLTETEATEVLDAACQAYNCGRGIWPRMSVEERIKCIEVFTYKIKEAKQEVVALLMWEIGKTFADAEKEFDRTIDYIDATIDALKDLDRISSRFVIEQQVIGQIRRSPLGVVLCMGPFNYPLNETFTTLIPALIMGNAVIFKPPKLGVLLHHPLLEAFRSAFPPGVVNTVYGDGSEVIGPLMASGKVDVLAFIGSSRVADILKHQHPKPHRLRCVLGLEAKNVAIVLPDADLEHSVNECLLGALSYNGQRCTALKLLFVHEAIRETFLQRLTEKVDKLILGAPWDKEAQITPLPEPGKIDYLNELLEDAKKGGATIINQKGGQVSFNAMHPAVVFPVNAHMRLYTEEQFGPIVPVAEFSDISEPMNYITQSNYGQQVSLFGEDPDTLATLIDPLVNQVSRVNINSQCQRGPDSFPFTGRKDSAEGTLSVSDALRAFSIRSLVAAKENPTNRKLIKRIVLERKSQFLSTDFIL